MRTRQGRRENGETKKRPPAARGNAPSSARLSRADRQLTFAFRAGRTENGSGRGCEKIFAPHGSARELW